MIILLPSTSLVLNAYAVLVGATPGNAALKEHTAYVADMGAAGYTSALNNVFEAYTNATMATALLANTGLGGVFTQADAEAYLAANAGNRVGAMISLANELYNYAGTNAALLSAKTAYMASIESSYNYSNVLANVNGQALAGVGAQTVSLTTGFDALVGGAMNDTFLARTINNVNTLQDGDSINGGAGNDTLIADMTAQTNAITPLLTNIETVVIRAQTTTNDATNGNNMNANTVQIDAQRSLAVDSLNTVTAATGVTRWESNNSRSDVIIEDVRIGNSQKTSDVTIAFVESDPGNVDFGVYFDQHSLRNASSGTSTLTIQLMDTGAAGATATAATPLLNQPYDQFKFAVNGVMATVNLNPAGNTTVAAAADTYAQLLAAFEVALVGTGATVALGANFTVTDPISGKPVTGQSIVLTGGAGTVITTPAGSGWFNTTGAAVPATANIYNTFATGATSQTELVTSKIVLDDVGRGSTGGDLVVGGMSVGTTSTSRGVERFEITVNDNSKLQTINSTNNALREVTIVNGATSKTVANAYTTTVTNEGDLTVNGSVANFDANLAGVNSFPTSTGGQGSTAVNHAGANAAGFTDVRLIDASAFKGKLAFTAAISADSIRKYVTGVDTAANPAADVAAVGGNSNFNVMGANFIYTGGNDNDTMVVTIDGAAAASRSSIVSGSSDMTFKLNGGAGNDAITVRVIDSTLAGGAQAWYNNQKLNANISIDAGEGNDTIRTPGAGDVVIDAGAGDDVVYTDNTGALTTADATGAAGTSAIAYANATAAELTAKLAATLAADATNAGVLAAKVTAGGANNDLNDIDLVTPATFVALATTHAAIAAATTGAAAAGAITLAQKAALDFAYGVTTALETVTAPATLAAPALTALAANPLVPLLSTEFTAGNALLATYIAEAKAAAAAATAADAVLAAYPAILTGAQNTVIANTVSMTGLAGTTTKVNNLATLQAALVVGATDVQVVAALQAATLNGAIAAGVDALLFAQAVATVGTMDAAELANTNLILAPLVNLANNANVAAAATLATNTGLNATAVNTAATNAGIAGTTLPNAAADLVLATAAANTAATAATAATTKAADLAALKAAIAIGSTELAVSIATTNAVAKGTILAGDKLAIDTAAGMVASVPTVAGAVVSAEKTAVDVVLTELQLTSEIDVASKTLTSTGLASVVAAATTYVATATAAAASGPQSLTVAAPTAVFVFNTSNQAASYNNATMDDRNLADLKSDANTSNNFFNSTVKVSYKGIDAQMIVAGTGYKTTDLEINQALKQLINNDAVLKTLLVASDGPANTLIVRSLIDGTHTAANLAVTVTLPAAGVLTAADIAGAAAAYGLPVGTTDATLVTTMATAKAAFDTKGDYTTQFAESGAAGGNTNLTGANSTSSSDNTVTGGLGNDVIVLGTTVGTDKMTSSNEKVVFSGSFGNDTIVNFAATGLGIDTLDFSALNGSGNVALNSLTADKSIVIGAPAATALTAVQIAALFTDSATAISHVYVAVNSTNIGSIWQVADAAGTAAGNVVATLVGSIDLADTSWSTLTAANFS